MSDLPEGWTEAEVSRLAEVFLGKTPAKSDYSSSGTYKVVKFRDLKLDRIDFQNAKDGFVRSDLKLLPSLKELREGDVLITSAAHSGENIGKKCVFVSSLPEKFARTFFTGELLNIRCPDSTVSKWIYLFFLSADGFKAIQGAVKGVHLTAGRAQGMVLPLAPLAEQRRIVAKLEALLIKIRTAQERLDKIPTLLKRFRQSVLTAACTGRLTADWREANRQGGTAADLLTAIQRGSPSLSVNRPEDWQGDPASDDIPITWLRCCLSQLFSVQTGATPLKTRSEYHTNGTIPWVKTGEVQNCDIFKAEKSITQLAVDETNAKLFPAGTLLIAMYGEGKTRGQVGRLRIKAATNQACAALVNPHLPTPTNEYVFYYCLTQYHRLRAEAVGGNQPNLNLGIIKQWVINLPSLDEQTEIVRRISSLLRLADGLEARYLRARARVEKLSQSALAMAFRGELAPTEAELARAERREYENAEQLLQSITESVASPRSKSIGRSNRKRTT